MVTPSVMPHSSADTFNAESSGRQKTPEVSSTAAFAAIHGPGRPMTVDVMTTPWRKEYSPLRQVCQVYPDYAKSNTKPPRRVDGADSVTT